MFDIYLEFSFNLSLLFMHLHCYQWVIMPPARVGHQEQQQEHILEAAPAGGQTPTCNTQLTSTNN